MVRLSSILLLSAILNASAATYYVATTGNNGNPGTLAQPWLTVQKGADTAVAGDTVNVAAGTYAEDVTMATSGTAVSRITFNGPGRVRRVIVDGSYITLSGLAIGSSGLSLGACLVNGVGVIIDGCTVNQMLVKGQNALTVEGVSCVITNCDFTGASYFSTIVLGGHDNLVVNSTVHDMDNADAFRVWGYNNIIRGNTVRNLENSDFGNFHTDFLQTFAYSPSAVSSNNIVENNLVRDINGQAFQLNANNDGAIHSDRIGWFTIRNNIFARMALSAFLECPNNKVYNNIFYLTATNGMQEAAIWIWATGLHGTSYGGGEGSSIHNNVFIGCGANDHPNYGWPRTETGSADYNFASTRTYGAKTITGAHSLTGFNPQFTDVVNLDFTIPATSQLVDRGTTAASGSQLDRAGVPRPQGATWDIGAYEYTSSTTVPSSGTLAQAGYTVSESAGTLTITANRLNGSSGALNVPYTTANGSAIAGVNYTTTSGTFSWGNGDATAKTVNVPILDVNFIGSRTFTFTISGSVSAPSTATITITGTGTTAPTVTELAGTGGFYKAGTTVAITAAFSTPVTVTGTPQLTFNTGGTANYVSGSGTSTLTFNYTPQAGHNTQDLDCPSNGLALNGGTIQSAGVDALLTLPTPGTPGALAYGSSVVIDTEPPALSFAGPVVAANGAIVIFTVAYNDMNFSAYSLSESDVTMTVTEGDVTGALVVSGVGIIISDIRGQGAFTITVASGTGVDLAGNSSAGLGPSTPVQVGRRVWRVRVLQSGVIIGE